MSDERPDPTTRRTSIRVRISTPVTVEHADGTFQAEGADFNEQSMLVLTDEELDLGTSVTLRCVDETGHEVVIEGEVTRHQPGSEEQPRGLVVTEKRGS